MSQPLLFYSFPLKIMKSDNPSITVLATKQVKDQESYPQQDNQQTSFSEST